MSEMLKLKSHDHHAVLASALRPDEHVVRHAAKKPVARLKEIGFAVRHDDPDCDCHWYVLTDAALAYAAARGITPAVAMPEQVSR